MLILKILFGVLYGLAVAAAIVGTIGLFGLLPSRPPDSWRWYARVGAWLASMATLSLLIATGVAMAHQWGPFAPVVDG